MRSTMLHAFHTRDANAERFQVELHNAQIQWTRGARGVARRLLNSSQVPARDQRHVNAVCAAHARELGTTLVEESPARIHQLMEAVPRSLHRKLQIHIQETGIA